jgi:hypothetical protein
MAKQPRRKSKRRRRTSRALTLTSRVAEAIPDSANQLPIVRRAFELLEDGEQKAEAGLGELDLAIARLSTEVHERFEAIETETEKRAQHLFRRFRASDFGKRLGAVPKQVTSSVDLLLDRVGLMRKARHEALLHRAKQRTKAAPRRRSSAKTPKALSAAGAL